MKSKMFFDLFALCLILFCATVIAFSPITGSFSHELWAKVIFAFIIIIIRTIFAIFFPAKLELINFSKDTVIFNLKIKNIHTIHYLILIFMLITSQGMGLYQSFLSWQYFLILIGFSETLIFVYLNFIKRDKNIDQVT
jgi:hypothetical protein